MEKIVVTYILIGLFLNATIGINSMQALSDSNNGYNTFYYKHKYAVIITGYYNDSQHYGWFTNDTQKQYNVLTKKYNFSDNDVYVLLTLKEEWNSSLHVNPDIIDYNATKENIKMVFDTLAKIVTEEDLLYVVVINHGGDHTILPFKLLPFHIDLNQGRFAHDTFFALEKAGTKVIDIDRLDIKFKYELDNYGTKSNSNNVNVYDYEFNNYIKDINARRIIFILQPCFSGGFINDLSGENRVVITASKENQLANAPFIYYFYEGLNGSINDTNNDGRISLAEIYEYTAEMVYDDIKTHPNKNEGRPQYPLIDDNDDKAGHRYKGWFGYDHNDPTKDGYVAARIYDLCYEEL